MTENWWNISYTELLEQFKEAYSNNDTCKCSTLMIHLILRLNSEIKFGNNYDHDLKHILFKTNIIRNPIGIKYSQDDYTKISDILSRILAFCKKVNDPARDTSDVFQQGFTISNEIIHDIFDIAIYTECLFKMNTVNSQRIDENEISKIPFEEQLYSVILFYQDQVRLLKQNYERYINKDLLTGMEFIVADKPVQYYEDNNSSLSDSMASMLESINEIVHYLYYKFGKTLKDSLSTSDLNLELIHPYKNTEFEKYMYIALQRHLLCRLEEGIRYGYYSFNGVNKDNEIDTYVFMIEDVPKYMARTLGLIRREYQTRRYSISDPRNLESLGKALEKISLLAHELIEVQADGYLLIDLTDFQPDSDLFLIAEGVAQVKEHIVELLTKEYYMDQIVSGVKICDLLTTYDYLDTLAEIIFCASSQQVNTENQNTYIKELCLVDLSYLTSELSRIHGYEINYSKKLIDRFIFNEKKNTEDDVFAQPLLKISKTQVLFCHGMIDQVNLDRFIERQFQRYEKDVSAVGPIFEKEFIETLKKGYSNGTFDLERKPIPGFYINENKVTYKAFDGKDIEFDVIAVLGEYLILTELKAVMTSYDLNDLEIRKQNVKKAITQLHRRLKSVEYDWHIIKEQVSIDLPEEPYDREHIILIACTDAYDFTPLKISDVYITDDSSYLKYFTNPCVETIERTKKGFIVKKSKKLWSHGHPDANEFMEYLINPVTIHPFVDYLDKQFIPVPIMDEKDIGIVLEEYILTEDPIIAETSKE